MKENWKTKTRRIKEKSEKSWLTKRFETLNNCQRGPIFVASAVVVAGLPDVSIQYINYANDSCFSRVCVARLVKDFIDESHIKKELAEEPAAERTGSWLKGSSTTGDSRSIRSDSLLLFDHRRVVLAVIALQNLYRNFYSLPPGRCHHHTHGSERMLK